MVDLWTAKRKHYDLIPGDVIGSSIVDATLSISISPIISPIIISGNKAESAECIQHSCQ